MNDSNNQHGQPLGGAPQDGDKQEQQHFNLQQLLYANLKRPWILVLTMLVILIPAAIMLMKMTRLYKSQATVMTSAIQNTGNLTAIMGGRGEPAKPMHYYTSILSSSDFRESIGEGVADRLPDVPDDGVYRPAMGAFSYSSDNRRPGIFQLTAISPNEELTQLTAQVALEKFRDRIISLDQMEARAAVEFIDTQLEQLDQKILQAEQELQEFLRNNQFVVSETDQGIAQELSRTEQQLSDARTQLNLIKLNIQSYERQIQEALNDYLETGEAAGERNLGDVRERLSGIRQRLENPNLSEAMRDSLRAQRRELSLRLLRQSSNVQRVEAGPNAIPLQELQSRLEQLLLERDEVQNRVQYYQSELQTFVNKHPNISQDILQYTRLVSHRDVLKQTMTILIEKREEARIKMASQLGGLKVLDQVTEPAALARNTLRKFAGVFIIALVIGVMLAYLVDAIRRMIDVDRDITDNFNIPLLGTLLQISAKDAAGGPNRAGSSDFEPSSRLVSCLSTRSGVMESLRTVKTSLFFRMQEENINCFVLTSALPKEGKSLSTANLAISMVQNNIRVLIVDVDLRRSVQHKLFSLPRKLGLIDYLLSTDLPVKDIIHQTHVPGLEVITAGSLTRNPSELIGSKKMRKLLDQLRKDYDLVLLDSSPILLAVDSRLLGSIADGVIMLARAEQTKLRDFRNALNMILNLDVRIIGAILNHASKGYGVPYYYFYGTYKSYYYYRPYGQYYGEDIDEIGIEEEAEEETGTERERSSKS